jgi:hypothetical protein
MKHLFGGNLFRNYLGTALLALFVLGSLVFAALLHLYPDELKDDPAKSFRIAYTMMVLFATALPAYVLFASQSTVVEVIEDSPVVYGILMFLFNTLLVVLFIAYHQHVMSCYFCVVTMVDGLILTEMTDMLGILFQPFRREASAGSSGKSDGGRVSSRPRRLGA